MANVEYSVEVQESISQEILQQVVPFLLIMSIISIPILLVTPGIGGTRLIPSLLTIFSIIIIWRVLKKGFVRFAASAYIGIIYLSIYLGIFINGGVYAPIYAALISMGGITAVFFRRKTVILLFILSQTMGILAVVLQMKGVIRTLEPVSAHIYLILNFMYQLLLLHAMLINVKMLHRALNTSTEKEREVKQSRNYIESIIESIGDGVMTVNEKNEITKINNAGKAILVVEEKELAGAHIDSILTVKQVTGEPFLFEEHLWEAPVVFQHLIVEIVEGISKNITVACYPMIEQCECHEKGTVIVVKDISDELLMKEQLVQSQKMEAVGQLSSGVAHDFNNMLGGIFGAIDLLEDEVSEEGKAYLAIIQQASKSASELTAKLLDFGRKGKSVSAPLQIHEVIRNSVAILERTIDKSISVQLDCSAENDTVLGDKSQLQNSLMNMGINASHAMPFGGKLIYSTQQVQLDETYCSLVADEITPGDYLEISVTDTGSGISEENLKKIFDPFFTTKEEGRGTGLGLAAVRGMVHSHGGTITVYSEEGNGTTFHIYLPLSEKIAHEDEQENGNNLRGNGERILLIDDEVVMQMTGKIILEKMNYVVDVVGSGEEGVITYRNGEYDLVLLDMVMPGMNGKETFLELHTVEPSVKVILTSGFSREKDVDEMKEDGLADFIRKPYHKKELLQVVASVLRNGDY